MQTDQLEFSYPESLVATEPSRPTRVLWSGSIQGLQEITIGDLVEQRIAPGDLLVINDTKVIPARVFAESGEEILFLKPSDGSNFQIGAQRWEVLFAARSHKTGDELKLPGQIKARLESKGLPQTLNLNQSVSEDYFFKNGEMALPPYIQQARGHRHQSPKDDDWYRTKWEAFAGSVAAPTASLHFILSDLDRARSRGVRVEPLTLHVGAGTFLPVRSEVLSDHKMHFESYSISESLVEAIHECRAKGGRVWALGTTVTRALEAWAQTGEKRGQTDLLIYPPYEFQVVGGLLTNFHQPRSTLLALVMAFAGIEQVREAYNWAIDKEFRLFSYGDLSAWIK